MAKKQIPTTVDLFILDKIKAIKYVVLLRTMYFICLGEKIMQTPKETIRNDILSEARENL